MSLLSTCGIVWFLSEGCLFSDAVKAGSRTFENIIVCQAQSTEPCGPCLVPIGDIADVPAEFANCGTYTTFIH